MRDRAVANVVCVHGAGGGGWEWAIWSRVLEAHGHIVMADDLRAVPAGITATHYADYRAQLLEWIAGLDRWQPVVLIGASLGGLLALDVAAEVDPLALVLVNPLPPAPLTARLPPRDWPDTISWGSRASLAGTRAALPDVDDAACLWAFRRWRDESGAVMRHACAGIEVASSTRPTRCVISSDDSDVPAAISAALARQHGASVDVIENASHVGPLLGASAAAAASRCADWLKSVMAC